MRVAYLIPDKKTWDREFGNLLRISDNYPKVFVSIGRMIDRRWKKRHKTYTYYTVY